MNRPEAPGIPDVQSCPDARELAIDRVGIRGLRYPMQFADGADPPQATVGSFNVYVALPAQQKGTHMSRLVAVIDEMRESLSLDGMSALLDTMLQRLDAEDEASCELYALLKRADEKYVTERAYDRPRFVEDLVRGIAARMVGDPRFEAFSVAAENFESIHNHSAYAEIVRGA